MKRMFVDIEKAQNPQLIGTVNFEEKRAAVGRELKSSPILGRPPNSFFFFDSRQVISK